MNWTEYKELSEKTLSYEFHCSTQNEIMLHGVMGFITELEELLDWGAKKDTVGMAEEFGDILWYSAIFGRLYDMGYPSINMNKNKKMFKKMFNKFLKIVSYVDWIKKSDLIVLDMYKKSSLILDIMKKKIFYNKPIVDAEVCKIVTDLMLLTVKFAEYHDIDIEKAMEINIAKLKARYGNKFTSNKAINRDLKAERDILEGK
jgi:NTP pyrophosphatase (non-canonical NTP hydrolase)